MTTLDDRPSAPGAAPGDAEALDAYSRVVTRVAEALGPSVANLRVFSRRRSAA
ncbi:MAG: peptidase S1, partial [Actinomycetota bacterium]|nr:peptidase S1 [Actinomycetota bacterium]